MHENEPRAGAINLLDTCLEARAGDTMIVLREDTEFGFYDCGVPCCVANTARERGLTVDEIEVGFVRDCANVDDALWEKVSTYDHAIFFARLGDQFRLAGKKAARTKVVIMYTLDAQMLGSEYGRLSHKGMGELKVLVDNALLCARYIRITSGDGTDLNGSFTPRLTASCAQRASGSSSSQSRWRGQSRRHPLAAHSLSPTTWRGRETDTSNLGASPSKVSCTQTCRKGASPTYAGRSTPSGL